MARALSLNAPFVLSLPWQEPEAAARALAPTPFAVALIGAGTHPLARWSYLADTPVETRVWTEGAPGGPFDGLQARLAGVRAVVDPAIAPFQGGWMGLLSHELGRAFERLPWPGDTRPEDPDRWPDVALALHDTVAAFDRRTRRLVIVSHGLDGPAKAKAEALAHRLTTPCAPLAAPFHAPDLSPVRTRGAVEAAVAACIAYIRAGDIFQANISQGFEGRLGPGDTPRALFARLIDAHPAPMAAFLDLGERAVVSHSPERFLTRDPAGGLETRPIKGTRPRHADPARDQAALAELSVSVKDRAENLMIVDLMRNDLSRVCVAGSVRTPDLCRPESFSTVHHLVSRVVGRQKPGLGFFDALAAAFPAGSVTGAPKVRALEIIAELEGAPRGPWCGSMIWAGFDGAGDSSVLIRTAACTRRVGGWHVFARAGAGVVADSDPTAEHEEMLVKVAALRAAVRAGWEAAA
jgi:para-aminobenzoate synthetase component 1